MNRPELERTAHRRLNVGCGKWPLHYWTNLDQDVTLPADIHADALMHMESVAEGRYDEIYAGHFIEHLTKPQADEFLRLCYRALAPGGRLGVVVPDTKAIMGAWLKQADTLVEFPMGVFHPIANLNEVCALFLYSTAQDSPHRWSYDQRTLAYAMKQAGFEDLREIDRYHDPRLGTGQWYQVGLDGWKR